MIFAGLLADLAYRNIKNKTGCLPLRPPSAQEASPSS
jgi:hypothetical protein